MRAFLFVVLYLYFQFRQAEPLQTTFASSEQMGKPISSLNYSEFVEELKKPNLVVVDVREPNELTNDGRIAQANNIPLGQVTEALKLDGESFKKKYNFQKPQVGDEIVVHCKAGGRAQNAAKAFVDAGFTNVHVYPGILDWKSNGGATV